jgi:hypothetical protein
MVVEAVSIESVSTLDSLLTGKKNRELQETAFVPAVFAVAIRGVSMA